LDFDQGPIGAPFNLSQSKLQAAAVSADGSRIVAVGNLGNQVPRSQLIVWDLAQSASRSVEMAADFQRIAVDQRGSKAWLGSAFGQVQLWDLTQLCPLSPIMECHVAGGVSEMAISANGQVGLTAGGGTLAAWDLTQISPATVHRPEPFTDPVMGMTLVSASPLVVMDDYRHVAGFNGKGQLEAWDAISGSAAPDMLAKMDSSDFDRLFAFAGTVMLIRSSSRGALSIWDARKKRKVVGVSLAQSGSPSLMVPCSNGQWMVIFGELADGVRVHRLVDLQQVGACLKGIYTTAACFLPDRRTLLTGSFDGQLTLVDLVSFEPVLGPLQVGQETGPVGQINHLVSLDNYRVLIATSSGHLQVWNLEHRKAEGPLVAAHPPGLHGGVICLAINKDKQLIATAGSDSVVRLWQMSDLSCAAEYSTGTDVATGLALCDGRLVIGTSTGSPHFLQLTAA
jgi:WD40 repeat protein